MKKKVFLGFIFALIVSDPVFGDSQISDELAIAKAYHEIIKLNLSGFSLDKIYSSSVQESAQRLTVEFKWMDGAFNCTGWQWFNFDGSTVNCQFCDDRLDGEACSCAVAACTAPGIHPVVTSPTQNQTN